MKIVITGPKCCGKTTIGRGLAEQLAIPFHETDNLIKRSYEDEHGRCRSCYEIWREIGEQEFRKREQEAVRNAADFDWCVLSVGGSTLLNNNSQRLLRKDSVIVLLTADAELLWERLKKQQNSMYLDVPSPKEHFENYVETKVKAMKPFADIEIDVSVVSEPLEELIDRLTGFFAVMSQTPNTFGRVIKVTTFGESHGPAVGAVLDGVRPGIELSEDDIQQELDRRRPGQSKVSTSRLEPDSVKILSGVFEGKTTGTPIAMLIENRDHDPTKYDIIRDLFRPGHADFTFWKKYGIRDHRGGGRSSGRETASRVAGGAVAKKILSQRGIKIRAFSREIGGVRAEAVDYLAIEKNPVRSPDPDAGEKMKEKILEARSQGDSIGGIVELRIQGIPAGLGDPVFGKLDARLAGALCSLGAVKGVEFGDGFDAARSRGSEFNDQMQNGEFLTNHAGGVLGGISSGQEVIVTLAVKPTPSISQEQKTIDMNGRSRKIEIEGRHDPCIVPRIVPVVESMAALVILDAWEIQNRLGGYTVTETEQQGQWNSTVNKI